jgi:septum formation protein
MTFEQLKNSYQFILASKSPRRQFLLKDLGLEFSIHTKDVDESFAPELKAEQIPLYLCRKKADAFADELDEKTIVITADTIVWVEEQVLNKPEDSDDAFRMLRLLSGRRHEVYTGVCLRSASKTRTFFSRTSVYFKELSDEEIRYYINNYQPYDKAGSYGAQEWIGYIAVEKIEGSYFNVMGLPLRELYEELLKF